MQLKSGVIVTIVVVALVVTTTENVASVLNDAISVSECSIL